MNSRSRSLRARLRAARELQSSDGAAEAAAQLERERDANCAELAERVALGSMDAAAAKDAEAAIDREIAAKRAQLLEDQEAERAAVEKRAAEKKQKADEAAAKAEAERLATEASLRELTAQGARDSAELHEQFARERSTQQQRREQLPCGEEARQTGCARPPDCERRGEGARECAA